LDRVTRVSAVSATAKTIEIKNSTMTAASNHPSPLVKLPLIGAA
jgi:hypothetical protein